VGEFHVGDRWVDNIDDEWWLYHDDVTEGLRGIRVRDGVSHWFIDGKNKLYSVTLTRLISSERWIPFAEMMPDDAHQETRTILVRDPKRKADDDRERLALPPTPGGIMLTTPIVEGAYYELSNGEIVKDFKHVVCPKCSHVLTFRLERKRLSCEHPCCGHRWRCELSITRRVYIVPTDPAEVVAELRERSESEWHSDETATRAYSEAADLVAEKLGVSREQT
jgi:hypothetical protein